MLCSNHFKEIFSSKAELPQSDSSKDIGKMVKLTKHVEALSGETGGAAQQDLELT